MSMYSGFSALNLPWEKMKNCAVLITGANGMIASALVEAIMGVDESLSLDLNLYALCRTRAKAEKRFAELLSNPHFHILEQDVTDPLTCDIDFQYIIHAASAAYPEAMNTVPVNIMKANFLGTMNLLEYAKSCTNCRFCLVSSSEVYGENEEGIEIFREDTLGRVNFTRFRACYPESKRAAETLCQCYKKQYGCDVVAVRPAFIFGRDIIDNNTRADVYFLRQGLKHEDIVMFSDGSQIRSYCYVKDCISGMLYVLLKGESGEVYNIGDKNCVVTLREYAQAVADAAGVQLHFDAKAKPEGTVFLKTTKLILDTAKLEGLGWKPVYSLAEGMSDIFGGEEK